jgi:hypothetical protein
MTGFIRLTDAEVREMRDLRERFPYIWSIKGLADWFGCNYRTVRKIVNYETRRDA